METGHPVVFINDDVSSSDDANLSDDSDSSVDADGYSEDIRSISSDTMDSDSGDIFEVASSDGSSNSDTDLASDSHDHVEPAVSVVITEESVDQHNDASVPVTVSTNAVDTRQIVASPSRVVSDIRTSDLDTSADCFKTVAAKKTVLSAPPQSLNDSENTDDAECCPICFEPWTNSGIHRLSCLRCGHLFGKSCIEKWLKTSVGKCPQCNAKAQRKDIRPLFARTLKMMDTTERDRALEELEKEKEARRRAELEAAKARMNHQMALNECMQLRQELERQRQQCELLRHSSTLSGGDKNLDNLCSQSSSRGHFMFEKHVRISEAGGCRVLTYCPQMATLCISQPSPNALFPGFGIKKLSSLDFKTAEYVSIHSKVIRDLAVHTRASDATLLSCSLDKFIKLTSLHSNNVIQMYESSGAVWSCTWNTDDRNFFYAGLQNGTVMVFDIRNLSEPVFQLNHDGESRSPVVSLQYLSSSTSGRPSGLLVGQLDRSSFYERCSSADYKIHLLPLEANLTSLSLEETTSHLLATYRPTVRNPSVRHQVCELSVQSAVSADGAAVNTTCACNSVHVFHSGATQKLLARSRLVLPPGNELLACAGDEASQSVYVWNAGTGRLQQKMSVVDPVIDLCPVTVNDKMFLIAQTEKQISVYQWKQTQS